LIDFFVAKSRRFFKNEFVYILYFFFVFNYTWSW